MRIAVIGDGMIDFDRYFSHRKVTDEGVDVYFDNQSTEERPGGASNVARMIESLGPEVLQPGCGLSIKNRYFFNNMLKFRIDQDSTKTPTPDDLYSWYREIMRFGPSVIVVCDHGKGAITRESIRCIDQFGTPVIYDPCMSTDWDAVSAMKNLLCVCGNRHEWGHRYESFDNGKFKIRRLDADGVEWYSTYAHENGGWRLDSICKHPVDSIGAGDQFVSVLAFKICVSAGLNIAIRYANIAAGLQCKKQGIQIMNQDELYKGAEKWLPVEPEKL